MATIAGPRDTRGGIARLDGYRRAVGDDFDPSFVRHGDCSRQSGAAALRELLDAHPDLDAVFAASDAMAAGAVSVLLRAGKRVPEDVAVAVAGFDDSAIATATEPALTTMRQPFDRISAEMVRVLVDIIDGAGTSTLILPTVLVERAST